MMHQVKSMPGARDLPERPAAGMLGNEGGFVLAFVMFMLVICMILGLISTKTGRDEIDISSNEVVAREVFTLAESGLFLAILPIITTEARGTWPTNPDQASNKHVFLNDEDPGKWNTTGGKIEIVDGGFLQEGPEQDSTYDTGANNWNKWVNAPDASHKAAYRCMDDPFIPPSPPDLQKTAKASFGTPAGADPYCLLPDIRIRGAGLLNMDIDVDKVLVQTAQGGNAEYATGDAGGNGTAYEMKYLFTCKATLPGKDITLDSSPKAVVKLQYRYLPK